MQRIKQDISIGYNLKRLRKSVQMTQEQVAVQMQLYGCITTRDIYAQMETGKYNIRISELLVMKEIFNCEIIDFFQELPAPQRIN